MAGQSLVDLGNNIRTIRIKKGHTMRTLAGLADMDKTHILKIEHGETDPKFTTLCRIAGALGVSVHDLIPSQTGG